jgi:hypothetical protein
MVFSGLFDGPAGGSNVDDTGFAAVRDSQFKFFRRHLAAITVDRFYDLSADPFETNNLANGPLTPTQQASMQALVDHLDDLRHPTGTATFYGAQSCSGSAGIPTIQVTGTPALGATYAVELAAAPAATSAILFTGISDSEWMGFPLPLDFSTFGGTPGCALYASGESQLTLSTDAQGEVSYIVSVPDHPLLLDAEIFHSWLIYDPASTSLIPFTTTQGMAIKFGN